MHASTDTIKPSGGASCCVCRMRGSGWQACWLWQRSEYRHRPWHSSLGIVQEFQFYVSAGDSGWVYKADYADAGNSGWSGPHTTNFLVGVLATSGHWIGLFAYEANGATWDESVYLYRE